jgi:hypothetical protein
MDQRGMARIRHMSHQVYTLGEQYAKDLLRPIRRITQSLIPYRSGGSGSFGAEKECPFGAP